MTRARTQPLAEDKGSSSIKLDIKRGKNMTPTMQHDDVMEHAIMARMHAGHGGPQAEPQHREQRACSAATVPPPRRRHRALRQHGRPAKPGAASMWGVGRHLRLKA